MIFCLIVVDPSNRVNDQPFAGDTMRMNCPAQDALAFREKAWLFSLPGADQLKSISTMILAVHVVGPIFQLARRFHAGIL